MTRLDIYRNFHLLGWVVSIYPLDWNWPHKYTAWNRLYYNFGPLSLVREES